MGGPPPNPKRSIARRKGGSSSDMSTYVYRPLKPGEVRILHLQPGDIDDSIRVDISHEEQDKIRITRPYRALSWQWGVQETMSTIRVMDIAEAEGDDDDDENQGRRRKTTSTLAVNGNLVAALKRIRHRDEVVRLWVDAICINQIERDDERDEQRLKNSEKREQVKMMTKIFGDARSVDVWLGEEAGDSDRAFDFIRELIRVEDSNYIASLEHRIYENHKRLGDGIQPLMNLLKRGWFSRRWVVQEIAVAQRATLYCGGRSISWDDLANAVTLLEKVARDGTINRVLKKHQITNHVPEYFGTISSLPAYRLVQTTTGIFRGVHGKERARSWRFTLEELVCYLAAFKSKRLHDTIYAVLGLASDFAIPGSDKTNGDAHQLHRAATATVGGLRTLSRTPTLMTMGRGEEKSTFEVDYNQPPLDVFKLFLERVIKKSRSLDILNRPWAPEAGFDASDHPETIVLPSWIASLSRKPFQMAENGNMFRFNPDPLVGPVRNRFYAASGNEEAEIEIGSHRDGSGRPTMTVRGFVLDDILSAYNASSYGAVPGDWLEAGGWEKEADGSIPPPPEALWRTLVADRDGEGRVPDRWYPMVFQSVAKERGLAYGFETYRLIHESSNAWIAELFRRVQAVVWDRRLIHTEGRYTPYLSGARAPGIGLAPKGAEKGDKVCIILGCSVPLVLRQVDDVTHANPLFRASHSHERGDSSTGINGMNGVNGVNGVNGINGHETESSMSTGEPEGAAGAAAADIPGAAVRRPPMTPRGEPRATETRPAPATRSSSGRIPEVKRNERNDGTYKLIGECYIDHMMDGEALAYLEETFPGRLHEQLRLFTLV